MEPSRRCNRTNWGRKKSGKNAGSRFGIIPV